MKRILVLSSFYPPSGGIAQTRIASFVRHLPTFGWEPSVVTIDWNEGNRKWIDRSEDSEELRSRVLYRTPQPDLRRRSGSRIPSLLRWDVLRADPIAVLQQFGDRLRYGEASMGSRFFVRAAIKFLRNHLRRDGFDAILATSPDLNPQIVASTMSGEFGIPWLADCRDDYAVYREGKPGYVKLEGELLDTAAGVVTVSNGVAEEIGNRINRKVEVVENGYEPQTRGLDAQESPYDSGVFNIAYTGSVSTYYPSRHNPSDLFEAIDLFLERNPDASGKIAMHFFGDTALQPIVDEFTTKFPRLEGVIRDHGRVVRAQALAAQRAAEMLLILAHPGRKGILTGKVFEYLAAQRPILCVPGDGDELDALLERTKAGTILDTAEEGAALLEKNYRQWESEGRLDYGSVEEEVARYSRAALTERLAGILNRIIGEGGAQ